MATSFRVTVKPEVLEWAIKRSQRSDLDNKFKDLKDWLTIAKRPTFKQLKKFAKAVYLPAPILLNDKPLEEPLPIADFRTIGNQRDKSYSGRLLDVIYDCQNKQDWYRQYCQKYRDGKNKFIGQYKLQDDPVTVAATIRDHFQLGKPLSFKERKTRLDEQGILVMTSGTVDGNNHRPLDVKEFRGFALRDDYAPIIFINAKDSENARSFTLIHELAHLALGNSGVSTPLFNGYQGKHKSTEYWCNQLAAEVLVPADSISKSYCGKITHGELERLAKYYKVSRSVILIRLNNLGLIKNRDYKRYYSKVLEQDNNSKQKTGNGGGNYYNTKLAALNQQFFQALVVSTLERNTFYLDAMRLAKVRKVKTFDKLAEKVLSGK